MAIADDMIELKLLRQHARVWDRLLNPHGPKPLLAEETRKLINESYERVEQAGKVL